MSCNGPGRKKSFTHIKHRAGTVRRQCLVQEKIAVLTPEQSIYFLLSGFQSSLLLIYFSDSLNGCSHCTKVWHKTYPLCDGPFSRSVTCTFTPSQKSRRNHQIRYDFRNDAKAIRYIRRRQQEQVKSNKFQAKQQPCTCIKLLCASLSPYSVNRIHLRPL